ncbi:MAG: hypothetical protein KDD12_12465 [Lewinella sp.]|nr:hypothetical protein [Lewinella sp.]
MKNTVNRYSDAELEEFRQLIDKKLSKARLELEDMEAQINEITENTEDDFGTDWMDDSSTASELDMLYNMANRQRKYIQDLDSALIRIKNKTYGICTVTGELIDKKRLLAVPTTTKSMNAKLSESKPSGGGAPASKQAVPDEDNDGEEKPKETAPRTPKVITKVIRKPSPGQASKPKPADDDDLDDIWPADIAANIGSDEEESNDSEAEDDDIDFDNFASDDDGGDEY